MPVATHAYGSEPHQVGELHVPGGGDAPAAGWPVAVLAHGGFWMTANGGADRMHALCDDLCARGWAAWNVEYRRLGGGSGGGWPQTAQDVAAAVDHLAVLEAPLDLARVVSIGHSAGGHLTLLDAAREAAAVRVAGTAGQAPLTDVALAFAYGGPGADVVTAFMGGTPGERSDAYAAASPVKRGALGVPILLVHGARDELVPPAMVADYAEAARAAGDEVEHVVLDDTGHFEHLDPAHPAWAVVTSWLARF